MKEKFTFRVYVYMRLNLGEFSQFHNKNDLHFIMMILVIVDIYSAIYRPLMLRYQDILLSHNRLPYSFKLECLSLHAMLRFVISIFSSHLDC